MTKYNEKVERCAPKLGRKNLANGLSCSPFVYMDDSDDGMWVHYVKYCENIAKQKYKRCLAMARWCESKVHHIRRTPLCDMDEHEGWQHDDEFWQRWHKRWLELAEKFKEAK